MRLALSLSSTPSTPSCQNCPLPSTATALHTHKMSFSSLSIIISTPKYVPTSFLNHVCLSSFLRMQKCLPQFLPFQCFPAANFLFLYPNLSAAAAHHQRFSSSPHRCFHLTITSTPPPPPPTTTVPPSPSLPPSLPPSLCRKRPASSMMPVATLSSPNRPKKPWGTVGQVAPELEGGREGGGVGEESRDRHANCSSLRYR